jgi:hypothetical protein
LRSSQAKNSSKKKDYRNDVDQLTKVCLSQQQALKNAPVSELLPEAEPEKYSTKVGIDTFEMRFN